MNVEQVDRLIHHNYYNHNNHQRHNSVPTSPIESERHSNSTSPTPSVAPVPSSSYVVRTSRSADVFSSELPIIGLVKKNGKLKNLKAKIIQFLVPHYSNIFISVVVHFKGLRNYNLKPFDILVSEISVYYLQHFHKIIWFFISLW